ncbi:MAG: ATP-binding cassette domain-containing protein [Candidatus Omnitrophica bacterium]|nr:ATP-binding cassette domain-containing protein [Candidatus Omnitrophota bacterium]
MISVENVSKSFRGQRVLDHMSLEVKKGEIVALLGPSGTGKTVLLLHLVGLMPPDEGRIVIDGTVVSELSEQKLLLFRRNIGYLFQDGALYDFMTVAENLAFPLKEHGHLPAGKIKARVEEYLAHVDMAGAGDKYPSELSGGMRKRVALARALIMDTKVLLCDEPTSGLDPIRSKDISLLIRDLARRMNTTTVLTSHDIDNSFRIADRMFVLDHGRVVAQGREDDLRRSTDPFVKEFLE